MIPQNTTFDFVVPKVMERFTNINFELINIRERFQEKKTAQYALLVGSEVKLSDFFCIYSVA